MRFESWSDPESELCFSQVCANIENLDKMREQGFLTPTAIWNYTIEADSFSEALELHRILQSLTWN